MVENSFRLLSHYAGKVVTHDVILQAAREV